VRMRFAAVLAIILTTLSVMAAPGDRFERFLFPVVLVDHPGAFGTIWNTEYTVRNEGDVAVEIFTSECMFRCDMSRCIFVACFRREATPARSTFPNLYDLTRNEAGHVGNPGTLLYVEALHAHNVFASLRLVESTGRANEHGVEIPVVRESELYETFLLLPHVPMPSSARTHLRLYVVESPTGAAKLRVRTYAAEGEDVLFERTVEWRAGGVPRKGDYDENVPGYSFVDLSAELSDSPEAVRVRVDSLTEGGKFWAMASVTSNQSQQVTLVTPQ
jgi:hypothetical protein